MKGMRFGIRSRLWLAAGLPALLAVGLLLAGFLDRYNTEVTAALRDRAKAAAAQLAGAADFYVFANNQTALQRMVDAALAGDRQMLGVGVYAVGGTVLAEAGRLTVAMPVFNGQEWIGVGAHLVVVVPIRQTAVGGNDLFTDEVEPRARAAGRQASGYVVVELTLADLEAQKRNLLVWALATTCVVLVLAGLLSSWIASGVTVPLRQIGQVVTRIGEGELDARAHVRSPGELASLAGGINAMASRVAMGREYLQQQVELATQELRRQKEAAELAARIDPLTGLTSRRAFTEIADAEIQRSLRYRSPLSLLMIDLDHFKGINDTHGHATGDAVLVSFAHTVSQQVREVDVAGRLGGEEFVVLLPNVGAAEAMQVAERMRQAVADNALLVNGQRLSYTASFGVAEFNPRELTLSSLLSRADAALYQAKHLGRNRVQVADPVVSAA